MKNIVLTFIVAPVPNGLADLLCVCFAFQNNLNTPPIYMHCGMRATKKHKICFGKTDFHADFFFLHLFLSFSALEKKKQKHQHLCTHNTQHNLLQSHDFCTWTSRRFKLNLWSNRIYSKLKLIWICMFKFSSSYQRFRIVILMHHVITIMTHQTKLTSKWISSVSKNTPK